MTPNEIIASYIKNLPPAIRPDVCFLLIGHLSDCIVDSDTDVEKEALEMICPANPAFRFRSVLCVAAYLDYLFATRPIQDNTATFLQLAEKTGNETWRLAAMRQPLTRRYWDAAKQKWIALRRIELTHDKIADWQRTLEMERMGILEPSE